ncbi:MAG: SIS domain-containing protein [Clostridia bacterium]|nr:SIS domain-containing protein [Clostridia bacterium]
MKHVDILLEHYPQLQCCAEEITQAIDAIVDMAANGAKLLLCGNGGSAADCSHIAGELLKGFLLKRPITDADRALLSELPHREALQRGICAISLPDQGAVLSAYANDEVPDMVYAQLVYAMQGEGDVFLGLSTSGNSKNVVLAAQCAKGLGLKTIAMTGESGGKLADICDIVIRVPATETYMVQEYHLPVYHAICAQVEETLFGE